MKKIMVIVILAVFVINFTAMAVDNQKSKNKIKADSPFYFLDKAGEKVNLFFTSDKNKAKTKFYHAYERLIEAKEMLEDNNNDKANQLFKEAIADFSTGVRLSIGNLINNEELQELKEKIKIKFQQLQNK